MAEITTDDITQVAKDGFYVAVGAGVIAFQKAQVQRVKATEAVKASAADAQAGLSRAADTAEELASEVRGRLEGLLASLPTDDVLADFKAGVETLVGSVDERVKDVEDRLDAVENRIEAVLDDLEAKLPEQAREVVQQARETARDARDQVRTAVGRAA